MKFCAVIYFDKVLVANSTHENYSYAHSTISRQPILYQEYTLNDETTLLITLSRTELLYIMFEENVDWNI